MLMFCNVGFLIFCTAFFLKLMFDGAFVGHRFDEDTPIAETVSGWIISRYDQLTFLILRCKRFTMSFKLATYATWECLLAGHGNERVSGCRYRRIKIY